jgi:hypothetical protein
MAHAWLVKYLQTESLKRFFGTQTNRMLEKMKIILCHPSSVSEGSAF